MLKSLDFLKVLSKNHDKDKNFQQQLNMWMWLKVGQRNTLEGYLSDQCVFVCSPLAVHVQLSSIRIRIVWVKFGHFTSAKGRTDTWSSPGNFNFKPAYCVQSIISVVDIDECKTGSHNCNVNANCTNTVGGHYCTCKEGFAGDGRSCSGKLTILQRMTIFKLNAYRLLNYFLPNKTVIGWE